jgi:hypothetical protein
MFARCSMMMLLAVFLTRGNLRAGEGDQPKRLEGEKAEKIARVIDEAVKKADKAAPVKVTPAYARAVGLAARDRGGLAVPDAKFSADALRKLDKGILPVGMLYLSRVTLVVGDEPVTAEGHRMVEATMGGNNVNIAVLHLAATKVEGRLVLLVYTNAKVPLVVTALVEVNEAGDAPVNLEARPAGADNRAMALLTLGGRYRAVLPIAASD